MVDVVHPSGRLAYWLVPDEPYLSAFKHTVSTLSLKFGGPEFIPHVTIYSGLRDHTVQEEKILSELKKFSRLTLATDEIYFGEDFKHSCYVKFNESPALVEMFKVIQSLAAEPDSRFPAGHLSLFYGKIPEGEKEKIRASIDLPDSIEFNLIIAMAHSARVKSREDIESSLEVARTTLKEN